MTFNLILINFKLIQMIFVYFLVNAQYTITDFFDIIKLSIFMTLDIKNSILSLGELDLTRP